MNVSRERTLKIYYISDVENMIKMNDVPGVKGVSPAKGIIEGEMTQTNK